LTGVVFSPSTLVSLVCDLLPSPGTERVIRRRIKVFALDQKLGAPIVAQQ
jgi:hypothetical protein